MRPLPISLVALMTVACAYAADEVMTFQSYVDSDLCARLMLGPITDARVACSKQTYKDGSNAVLVRLKDNLVFEPNKDKLIKNLVGQLAEVSGKAKPQDGTIKLDSAKAIESSAVKQGDPGRKLLDVRTYKTTGSANFHERIRHELAMMPYITEFDFISFTTVGYDVILSGWTVRTTNRSEAYNRVRNLEGVEKVVNNIEVLPLGQMDNQIRFGVRARLQRMLSRYFWGSGSDIKIIVKNGDVILLGSVTNKGDSDIANIQANSVPGAFHVFNLLRVVSGQ